MNSRTARSHVAWETIFSNASSISTVIAAVIAIVAFYYGYRQFLETQDFTRESQAVELCVKYNEVMKDAGSAQGKARDWLDNLGVTIAESIYRIRRGDRGWENTVKWMLSNHQDYMSKGLLCDTFDRDFVKLMQEQVKTVCELHQKTD